MGVIATTLIAVALAACGGSKPAPTTPPTGATTGLVIVDDIDCPKLVNHMIDVHVTEAADKAAADPDQIKQIRVDMEKQCTEQYTANPPTAEQKTSAQCSMKAQTTAQLEICGS